MEAMQQVKQFLLASVPVQADGWLSPEGVYYPCGFGNHDEAAREIAGVSSSYCLEERGWLHITDSQLWLEGALTQPQIDTLFDMLMVNPASSLGINIARYLGEQG